MKSELLMHEHQELDSRFLFHCDHAPFSSAMLPSSSVPRPVPLAPKGPSRTLFRLLPTNLLNSQICLNTWLFVSLEVVGEFGRYQNGADPLHTFRLKEGQQVLPLECRLIGEDGLDDSSFALEKREVQSANWHDTESLSGLGIGPSGRGGFEIRIVRRNGLYARQGGPPRKEKCVCIWIGAETDHRIVPVVLGPITLSLSPWQPVDHRECRVMRPFHIPALGGRMKRTVLLHEIWNNVPQGRVWDSAFGMVELFSRAVTNGINATAPPLFAGKRILDLSAGTGLLGLYVAGLAQIEVESQLPLLPTPTLASLSKSGPTRVTPSTPSWSSVAQSQYTPSLTKAASVSPSFIPSTTVLMTDLPDAIDLINRNIITNRDRIAPNVKLEAKQLRWGTSHLPSLGTERFDIVIASDVVYDRNSSKDLLDTLRGLCTSDRTTIYLGCKRRRQYKDLEEEFLQQARVHFRAEESVDDLGIQLQAISLSIQRARIYIMLAGSGLCLLVAAHLMMVHLVGNMQNSLYHPMAPPPSISAPNLPPALNPVATTAAETQVPPSTSSSASSSSAQMDQRDKTPKITPALMRSLLFPDFLEKALEIIDYLSEASTDQESIGTSPEHKPASGGTPASTLRRRGAIEGRPLFKTLVPTHLMHPTQPPKLTAADGEAKTEQQRERDLSLQQSFAAEPVEVVFLPLSPPPSSKESVPIMDIPISEPMDASEMSTIAPVQPKRPLLLPLPPLDPISILLLPSPPSSPSPVSPPGPSQDETLPVQSEPSRVESLFYNTRRMSPGYNLAGLHWVLFVAAQGCLILLLLLLFLGVLIMTEYVLDREDEDLVRLKYHYWARILGIATATVLSALHGSFISGYVLLDGVSDWIAKATVAAICGYWLSMTWVMNRVTGPLPY
ncbi:unnamed protein product [Mortierella alpina]